jgi:hypothetical protein
MDQDFLTVFGALGTSEILRFSQYNSKSSDFFKIRSETDFELSGPVNGFLLKVTFKKEEQELIAQVWSAIDEWVSSRSLVA